MKLLWLMVVNSINVHSLLFGFKILKSGLFFPGSIGKNFIWKPLFKNASEMFTNGIPSSLQDLVERILSSNIGKLQSKLFNCFKVLAKWIRYWILHLDLSVMYGLKGCESSHPLRNEELSSFSKNFKDSINSILRLSWISGASLANSICFSQNL